FDEKYRDAFFYVFGDTLVVQTLDEARKWMGGVRLVTIEGELIEASGAMVGGEMERSTVKFGPTAASEMEKIAEKLREAQAERKKAVMEATPQQISSRMKELMNRRATFAEELSGLRSKLEAMTTQTTFLDERRTELDTRIGSLEDQRKEHEKRIEAFEASLGRLETEIRGLEKTEAQMGKKLKDLQDARDAAYKEKTDREADLDKVTHKIET